MPIWEQETSPTWPTQLLESCACYRAEIHLHISCVRWSLFYPVGSYRKMPTSSSMGLIYISDSPWIREVLKDGEAA